MLRVLVARKVSSSVTGCSARWPSTPDTHQAADDHGADAQAAQQRLGAAAFGPREHPGQQRQADQPAQQGRRLRHGQASGVGQQRRQVLPRGQRDHGTVHRGHTRHGGDATQRGVGRDAQHAEDHQRLQAATADAHQRLAAAARGQHHAEAEQGPAQRVRQPDQLRSCIDTVTGLHPAQRHHGVEAQHRHAHRQRPHAQAGPVAHRDDVRQRAHGAEVGALRHGAKDRAQGERGPEDLAHQAGKLGFVEHGARILGAPAGAHFSAARRSLPAAAASDWG